MPPIANARGSLRAILESRLLALSSLPDWLILGEKEKIQREKDKQKRDCLAQKICVDCLHEQCPTQRKHKGKKHKKCAFSQV